MPHAVADGLSHQGFDGATSTDAGLLAAGDPSQLAFALRKGRVLVTRVQDFLRLHAAGIQLAGIVYWTERQRTVGQLIGALASLTIERTAENLRGTVTYQ